MTDFSINDTMKRILNKVEVAPATTNELAALLHRHRFTIEQSVARLKAYRLIYIASYKREGERGPAAKVYALGNKPNAQRPNPKPPAEKCADWRSRGNDSHLLEKIRRTGKKIEKATINMWGNLL